MKPEPINALATVLRFPEGPVFLPDGALWCVEAKGGGLVRLKDGVVTRVPTGGAPNGLAVDGQARIWICDSEQCSIRRLDPSTNITTTIADQVAGQPLNKPNDLAFDAAGNVIFTCPGNSRQEPTGYVCCLTPAGAISVVARGMFFPNGLAFVDEGRTLIVAETYRQRLWKGTWDARERRWLEAHVWAEGVVGAPGPDGMAIGADGRLYVAVYGSSQVKVFDAAGRQVTAYDLPGKNPTNCAFDPAGSLGLVVTEAEQGILWSLPQLGPGLSLFTGGNVWK